MRAALLVLILAAASANAAPVDLDHSVARVGLRIVKYRDIAYPDFTGHTKPGEVRHLEQINLNEIIAKALFDAAAKRLGVEVADREVADAEAKLGVNDDVIDKATRPAEMFMDSLMRTCDGEDAHAVYQQLIATQAAFGTPRLTEEEFLTASSRVRSRQDVVDMRAHMGREATARSIDVTVRQHILMQRVLEQIRRRGEAPSAFFQTLIVETGTVILDPAYSLPKMEDIR